MKTKTDNPAAAVESARIELEEAQAQLAAIDPNAGALDTVLSKRRDLQARVELARERLELATARADEAEYAQAEARIAELQEQHANIEAQIEAERERVDDELHKIFLADWLDGTGRFSSSAPQGRGLVSMASSVQELIARRVEVEGEIRRLQDRIAQRRSERDREAASARVEARRRLLAGDAVKIAFIPWKMIPLEGHTSDVARTLARRVIPAAIPPDNDNVIHALLPEGSRPWAYCDEGAIIRAAPMDANELTPVMAEVFARSR